MADRKSKYGEDLWCPHSSGKCCSNFRTSMVKIYGVLILRVNAVQILGQVW